VALVSTREPLDQYTTLPPPPETVGTPLPRRLCLFSFSLSLFHPLFYPPVTPLHRGRRVRPPPGRGTIRWKRAFGRPKTRKGNTPLSRIFRHTLLVHYAKKKKEKKEGKKTIRPFARISLENGIIPRNAHPDFSRNSRERKSFGIKCNACAGARKLFPWKLISSHSRVIPS